MFTSARYSYLALKISLAVVFLWFGVDQMLHASYWLNAWVPDGLIAILDWFKISGQQFIYITAIFEILTGVSLITGVFTKIFAILAALFLILVLIFTGVSEITIRDVGLIGALIAVLLWPEGRSRF